MADPERRVAVLGAGVSGIAAANVWKRCGYEVTVFEAGDRVGGQWAQTYPGVSLQNTAPQYQFADFPWPFTPDRHPSGAQVLRYLEAAALEFGLDVRLGHRVEAMVETAGGWRLTVHDAQRQSREEHEFEYVVIATGQYPGGEAKHIPAFPGIEGFTGEIVTNIATQEVFRGKRVVVIGFGKTALDFASWSADIAQSTVHVFRTARWTIPDELLGIDFTRPFFARFGSEMMPSWVHSSVPQRILHRRLGPVVQGFWWTIASLFALQHRRDAQLGEIDRSILDPVIPPKSRFVSDLRSASAVAPKRYYQHVAHGRLGVRESEVASFEPNAVVLKSGERIAADLVAICCGNAAPTYPYLPDRLRALLEGRPGGPALYHHLVHPQIPRLGFAGYNHGFLHIALCEMGSLWQVAAHRGEIALPSEAQMLAEAERVAAWKREHSAFEPTANMAVNTRFQQYLDMLMQELGFSQWRKLPNLPAELFARYDPTDYAGLVDRFAARSRSRSG
jgi:dimethylaniline monooxygenase (N-oxide forming)